jgi:hypothetical protein
VVSVFPKRISEELNSRVGLFGFKKKGSVLQKTLKSDASAFLGLGSTSLRDGSVTIFPVVGVRFETVYKMGLELGCYPTSRTSPTLSVALEYLIPPDQRRAYRFVEGSESVSELERLTRDIQTFAFPFYDAFDTVEKAKENMLAGTIPELNGASAFLPIQRLLAGDCQSAVRLANDRLATMDQSRGTGQRYAAFVARLSARCAANH